MPPAPKRRLCKLTEELQREFPYIHKSTTPTDVLCNTCHATFSIAHGGKSDITRHISSEKHKKSVNLIAGNASVKQYFRQEKFGDKEAELAKAEGVWAFHTVQHNQSFNSMDCTSKLIQRYFEKKFTCSRTKCEAIVKNVIAPYSLGVVKKDLDDVPFVTIFSDASNHKNIKLFPTLVRYFHPKSGINVKLIDFVDLPGETSEIIHESIIEILEKHALKDKMVGFCADNANTNFGGVNRGGRSNIYYRLKESLSRNIVGVGCAAHIAHNAMQMAADLLPIDVENIVVKVYSYFYIYTVRVEELKTFCEDAEIQCKSLLGYSKTRWLALLPAVERISQLFSALKSYFLSQDKCPNVLSNFFSNESSQLWLKFIHNQAAIFNDVVKKMEGNNVGFSEVSHLMADLKLKFSNRLENNFLPLIIRNELTSLEENGQIQRDYFMSHVRNFYNNCIKYLDKYSTQYQDFQNFDWVLLNKLIVWTDIQPALDYYVANAQIQEKNKVNEDDLFGEICYLSNYLSTERLLKWREDNLDTEKRWIEVFALFSEKSVSYKNCLLLVQYILCFPGTNAPTERVFSLMNAIWTSEKTAMTVETIRAILQVRCNVGKCEEFYNILNRDPDILRKIHSSEKYK